MKLVRTTEPAITRIHSQMLTKVAGNSVNEGPIMVLVLVLERKLEEVYGRDFSITILPEHISMADAITT